MSYIFLSVLLNASLFVIFKLFEKFKVNTFQAIVFNYFIAFFVAYFSSEVRFSIANTPYEDWFLGASFLGFLFVTMFYILGLTAQKLGMSVVAVSSKMSVIIPIIFGVFIYNESVGVYKVIGIVLALIAVYFTSLKDGKAFNASYIYLPVLLFFGSGMLDTTLKYIEITYVSKTETSIYLSSIFLIAGVLGCISLLYLLITKKTKITLRSIIGGIVLGIPNYYAMYYLLKALQTKGLESSTIFTINNVAIVLLSTLLGLFLFKEKISKKNSIGIILAIVSISLITLTH